MLSSNQPILIFLMKIGMMRDFIQTGTFGPILDPNGLRHPYTLDGYIAFSRMI
jgi:hypothetical protein